jgi:hypothetical protein
MQAARPIFTPIVLIHAADSCGGLCSLSLDRAEAGDVITKW